MPINGRYINDAQSNGFYAPDEADYQLWLRDEAANVTHLIHLSYNGTSAVYPNWVQYTLKLSDRPLAGYHDVIKALPSFSRAIGADFFGEVNASIGEIVLDNADGALDLWHNLSFDGQTARVFQGDETWPIDRFRIINEAVVDKAAGATLDTLTIRLRGQEHNSNGPIQTKLIPPATGTTANGNTPVPLTFGKVFNIRPAVIDEKNATRQWNDGAVTEVTQARDSGIPFQTNLVTITSVNAGADTLSTSPASHGFVKDTRVRSDVATLPAVANWKAMAWNGEMYLAVAYESPNPVVALSRDGIKWTLGVAPFSSLWNTVTWNGSVFLMTVDSLTSLCAISKDGINWTQGNMVNNGLYAVAWGIDRFVAVRIGTLCAMSFDGLTWTSPSMPSSDTWGGIVHNGSFFCATGTTKSAISTDGINWTQGTMPGSAGVYQAIAWNGSVFCALGNNVGGTAAATSPDGLNWTAQVVPAGTYGQGSIVWNGRVFLIISQATGTVAATSPDGVTWTPRTLPASAPWRPCGWDGYNLIVLGGGSSYATLSGDDGATWTSLSNSLPAPLLPNTDYFVSANGLTNTDFKLTGTRGGTSIIDITGSTTGAGIVGYHWTQDYATGVIYLDSDPAGEFTLDGTAGTTAPASILPTVLGTSLVDAQSKIKFAETCPQTVGIYVEDRQNRIDVASDLLSGLGAWFGYSRYGIMLMGRIEAAYASHEFEIIEDQMIAFQLDELLPPRKRNRVTYRKNWTNQAGALAGGVSQEAATLYSTDYSVATPALGLDEGPAGQEYHKAALFPDVIESMMALSRDALDESVRRNALFYGWGAIFSCTIGRVGREIDPGDVVKVSYSRHGLNAGVRMPVIYVEDRPTERTTVLKFFAALAAYAPGQL